VFKTKKIQLLFYVYKTGRCNQFRKASKTKKRDNLSIASRFVPEVGMTFALTSFGSMNPGRWAYSINQKSLRLDNRFYENVDELYALKETLIQQGILSNDGNGLALARD